MHFACFIGNKHIKMQSESPLLKKYKNLPGFTGRGSHSDSLVFVRGCDWNLGLVTRLFSWFSSVPQLRHGHFISISFYHSTLKQLPIHTDSAV
jgi:hypothetical protein